MKDCGVSLRAAFNDIFVCPCGVYSNNYGIGDLDTKQTSGTFCSSIGMKSVRLGDQCNAKTVLDATKIEDCDIHKVLHSCT